MPLLPGARVGPYEILGALGAGGMGVVYRARDPKLSRDVAIKVLPELFSADADRLARFEREAQSLGALNHPHIAQIYGVLESPAALVMELVDGEDLSQQIAGGPIPLDQALAIARQIADALDAAHERGIIHRDLKPANIKVREDGTVKVLDFGLAKAAASAASDVAPLQNSPTLTSPAMTQMGVILGTAAYMSPEQAKGKPVDKRADIWAFGCVLFEMLSGTRPFPGSDVSDTLASVLAREVDWTLLPPATPAHIRTLLRRCLEKDPRKRLRDIGDARVQLDDVAALAPVPDVETRTPSRGARLLPWGIAAASVLAAVILLVFYPRPGNTAEPGTIRMLVNGPVESEPVFRPVLAPDGSFLIFQGERLYIRRLSDFSAQPLPGTEHGEMPVVSPDGKWVGFYADGKIKKVAVAGGEPLEICSAEPDSPGMAWGFDNRIYFSPGWADVTLLAVSADGGTPAPVSALDAGNKERGHWNPEPLPGGRHVLFTVWYAASGLNESKIGALDLQTGKHRTLFPGANPRYAQGQLLYYHAGGYKLVPFDSESLTATGDAQPVLPDAFGLHPQGSSAAPMSLSASGTVAYVVGEVYPELDMTWVSRDGRQQSSGVRARVHETADLSPDGEMVAFGRPQGGTTQIFVADVMGRGEQRLSAPGMNWGPSWHPDGKRLAFSSMRKGDFDTYMQGLDGSPAEVIESADFDEAPAKFLSSGRQLISKEWRPDGTSAIVLLDLETKTRSPLVSGVFQKGQSSVSPRDRWLAVVANPTGAWHVHIRPLTGSSSFRQVTREDVPDDATLRWAPRGTELFFVRGSELVSLPLEERGDTLLPLEEKVVATLPRAGSRVFGVSPDGARVLVGIRQPRLGPRGIRVIINGLAMLGREPRE